MLGRRIYSRRITASTIKLFLDCSEKNIGPLTPHLRRSSTHELSVKHDAPPRLLLGASGSSAVGGDLWNSWAHEKVITFTFTMFHDNSQSNLRRAGRKFMRRFSQCDLRHSLKPFGKRNRDGIVELSKQVILTFFRSRLEVSQKIRPSIPFLNRSTTGTETENRNFQDVAIKASQDYEWHHVCLGQPSFASNITQVTRPVRDRTFNFLETLKPHEWNCHKYAKWVFGHLLPSVCLANVFGQRIMWTPPSNRISGN